jgi:hypothetical protein
MDKSPTENIKRQIKDAKNKIISKKNQDQNVTDISEAETNVSTTERYAPLD